MKEERLAHLEEKLDRLLNSRFASPTVARVDLCSTANACTRQDHIPLQEQPNEEAVDASEKSFSASPPGPNIIPGSSNIRTTPPAQPSVDIATGGGPGPADVALGIRLYFEYCHRQPIWCFEYDDVGDYSKLSEELACSILALTSRFSPMRERLSKYTSHAKRLIMLRVANSTVELSTMESLCLLSYSSFIGKPHST